MVNIINYVFLAASAVLGITILAFVTKERRKIKGKINNLKNKHNQLQTKAEQDLNNEEIVPLESVENKSLVFLFAVPLLVIIPIIFSIGN
ncbi:hypothetical protein [Lysinibacillus irui]|uniref:Uncharacterized protein n=1 Tax=Lysinibacillus irui TaxID=2998077 RepID=A0AAJ5RNN6_9BACI|nr:hypothetical protein [Lysinibacillus irui]WDV09331.1 hypothetical protein OU989_22675 [Lysinibacillus irui]